MLPQAPRAEQLAQAVSVAVTGQTEVQFGRPPPAAICRLAQQARTPGASRRRHSPLRAQRGMTVAHARAPGAVTGACESRYQRHACPLHLHAPQLGTTAFKIGGAVCAPHRLQVTRPRRRGCRVVNSAGRHRAALPQPPPSRAAAASLLVHQRPGLDDQDDDQRDDHDHRDQDAAHQLARLLLHLLRLHQVRHARLHMVARLGDLRAPRPPAVSRQPPCARL